MTTFLLIRHGLTDAVGKRITGRLPGVHLNQTGQRQAGELRSIQADAIYASPLERAQETARPLAQALSLPVETDEAFSEFDFGEWSGTALDELDRRPEWRMFNQSRGLMRAPGGENMLDVQLRMTNALGRLQAKHPERTVAVISHADAIRAAISFYSGAPADLFHRFEIAPASVSVIRLEDWGPRILALNAGPGGWQLRPA